MPILPKALLLWLALLPAFPAPAQSPLSQKRVTLFAENVPLPEVLARLEKQHGVPFAYFPKPELLARPVTLWADNEPLDTVLDRLFAQTALSWQLVGNQVVIREAPSAPPAYLTLHGKVLDGETGAPLPYASVSLQGGTTGTVTNPAGDFVFHVPDRHADDTLLISFLGYAPYRETVQKMATQAGTTVRLPAAPVQLTEVVVSEKVLTPREIVQAAVARIGENYPADPCLMEGFYREWHIRYPAGDTQAFPSLVEAAVSIHDLGYGPGEKARQREKVFITEIRRSVYSEDTWNKLSRLLTQNFVKHNGAMGNYDAFPPVLQFPNALEYKALKTAVEDGESFHVIAVPMPGSPVTCELYISYDDYAIARIDLKGEGSAIQSLDAGKQPAKRPARGRLTRVDNSLRFRRVNNKMYLSYLRAHWKTRIVDPKSSEAVEDNTFFSELLVSDIKTDNPEAEAKKRAGAFMKPGVPMAAQTRPYNPAFWQHYNIIQDHPLDPQISRDLAQKGALDAQFREALPAETRKRIRKKNRKP